MVALAALVGLFTVSFSASPDAGEGVRWKMASAFPGKLVQLGSLGRSLSKKLKRISGGDIRLEFFEPYALVPPFEMFDAVSSGSIDAAWSTPGYWFGKEPALVIFSAVPFGPGAGEYLAWIYHGGGYELMSEIYRRHDIHSVVCGIIAPEASGWFRTEIKSIDDLKGLRMRLSGLAAKVMEKIGVSTQLIAGDDIYPALELGSIDATEYSMPAIDLDLGFYQVAKHYYFPGWHRQSTLLDLMINLAKWNALDDTRKAQIEVACGDNIREGLAEGEAIQGRALMEIREKGVQIHRWSPEILAELEKAWEEVAAELVASDASFKKVWGSYQAFRQEYAVWGELGYLE